MNRSLVALVLMASLLSAAPTVLAQITIETVPVGDPGNAADTLVMTTDGTTDYGSVAYDYLIGKYEVTAAQYTAFLNAVAATDTHDLYNSGQARTDYGSGITRSGSSGSYTYSVHAAFVDRPVNFVSFWDACRFANWLHNGQPTGEQNERTTEDGAYTLTPDRIAANSVTRNEGAKWAVTSEQEWYKAAQYRGGGPASGYWLFPTRSDTLPGRDLADFTGNNANYFDGDGEYPIQAPYYSTTVGQFQNSPSPYGTFDMGGNELEWNEAIIAGANRGVRGGSFSGEGYWLRADYRYRNLGPGASGSDVGFRVVKKPCEADLEFDGLLDFADYLLFLNYYDAGDLRVDYTGDGLVDFSDYLEFLNLYGNSCEED